MSDNKGFLSVQSMWIGLGVAAVLMFGWRAFGPQPETAQTPVAFLNVGSGPEATVEKLGREQCLAREDRLWAVSSGVECIAFVASPGAQGASQVLVFLNGDVKEEDQAGARQESERQDLQRRIGGLSAKLGVPMVVLGRPGLLGSSGVHLLGGRRDEGQIIDAALDALKQRLGLRRMAIAGQSGGARIIAQLMVIGRRDIACAAMGSGAFGVPQLRGGGSANTNIFGDPGSRFLVPLLRAGEVPPDSARRSFVIGDPRDKVAAFAEQKAWSEKLAALGHHVQLIEAQASDPDHHGMSANAMTAGAMCLQEKNDADIRAAVTAR